jgi:hypothetical protein
MIYRAKIANKNEPGIHGFRMFQGICQQMVHVYGSSYPFLFMFRKEDKL